MCTVLFVDDEDSTLLVAEIMLLSMGVTPVLADCGTNAIEILSDSAKRKQIDIIFLDLTMPDMNGIHVLEWMRENNIHIPVVIQTGIDDRSMLHIATRLGAVECLIKPYTKDMIYKLIQKYAKDKNCA